MKKQLIPRRRIVLIKDTNNQKRIFRDNIVSVIIPVYNVELYLRTCIDSIVKQTYVELEIILVDDGSTDKSGLICDEYAKKDERIKVIHKKNGGLSDARNEGLKIATGEFVGFVDSDDWVEKDFFEKLVNIMYRTKCDIAMCGIKMFWGDGTEQIMTANQDKSMDNLEAMEAIVDESFIKQPVWYKLYRHNLVNGIMFEVGKIHEDAFWTYQIIARAKKVEIIKKPYYYYRQRKQSIMSAQYSYKNFAGLEARIRQQCFLENNYQQLTDKGRINLLFAAYYHGVKSLEFLEGNEQKEILKMARGAIALYPVRKEYLKKIKFTHRIWVIISRYNFTLGCYLRKLFGIGLN